MKDHWWQMSQFLVVTPPPLMTPQGKIPFFGEDTLASYSVKQWTISMTN